MDVKAVVVSGEAPESDDDSANIATGIEFSSIQNSNYCGTIISGEAPESDDDGTSLSSVSGAVDAIACMPYTEIKIPKSKKHSIRYNSLLHKKLRTTFNTSIDKFRNKTDECNETLDKDFMQMIEGTIGTAAQELSCVNRQLLKSELILQEAVCQLRSACIRTKDTSNALHQVIDVNFLQSIKT